MQNGNISIFQRPRQILKYMALFSSIRPQFSFSNQAQNVSFLFPKSPISQDPIISKKPVTNNPEISVSASPIHLRPVTRNDTDPSSKGSSRIFIKGNTQTGLRLDVHLSVGFCICGPLMLQKSWWFFLFKWFPVDRTQLGSVP